MKIIQRIANRGHYVSSYSYYAKSVTLNIMHAALFFVGLTLEPRHWKNQYILNIGKIIWWHNRIKWNPFMFLVSWKVCTKSTLSHDWVMKKQYFFPCRVPVIVFPLTSNDSIFNLEAYLNSNITCWPWVSFEINSKALVAVQKQIERVQVLLCFKKKQTFSMAKS